ncbi:MAG: alpha/beta hydrolase family protein [Leptothrix sp. (in: b-proteobacteria)]
MKRRELLSLGAGALLGALNRPAWAAGGDADVAPARSVQVIDFDWVDPARDRAVPVRLHWPDTMPATAPGSAAAVPLLVFSHGLGGTRQGYSYLGRHVAEHGIASLHVQHVGSDRSVWMGSSLTLVFRLMAAAQESEALARVQDLRFALDQLLAQADFGPRIDTRRIAVGGHSYGATTSMLATGARVERRGQVLALRDERLRGALLLSSPPFYGEADQARVLAPLHLPSLHVTTTEDIITVPGYRSPAADRLAVFDAIGSVPKALAVFAGGPHNVFTDRTGAPGTTTLNGQIKAATQELALDFLQGLFAPTGPVAADFDPWRSRHAPLLARFDWRGAAPT